MLKQWWTDFQPAEYPWLGDVFVLVLILLGLNLVLGRLITHLGKKFEKTHNLWDDALLEAARRPALLMIWAVGGSHVLEVIAQSSEAEVFSALDSLRAVGVVLILAWFLVSLVRQVELRLLSDEYSVKDEPIDQTTVMALGKLIR